VSVVALASLVAGAQGTPPSFTAIDLGTLGGTESTAWAANDRGQVVGSSTRHAFFWTQEGGMVDLGTLGGAGNPRAFSIAFAVNDAGQVVGSSTVVIGPDLREHAFSWTQAGGMIDLGTLGGIRSTARAVNENGQVVGFSNTAAVGEHAFSWTQAEGMVDLGTLGGPGSAAWAVNDRGQVVGSSGIVFGSPREHAFSWTQAGGMVDLGTLGGGESIARAVNGSGQVVGNSTTADASLHAFSWTHAGGMVDLGTLGGTTTFAAAVNEGGQVVGAGETSGGADRHAFSWTQAGGMIDLGTLGGGNSIATAVNDRGQVVGHSTTPGGSWHAFSWTQAGGMVDLGTLGGSTSFAAAVSDSGAVAGNSDTVETGASHAVQWQPADTPPPGNPCAEITGQGELRSNGSRFDLSARYKERTQAFEGQITYSDPSAALTFGSTEISGIDNRGDSATITGSGLAGGLGVTFEIMVSDVAPGLFSIRLSNRYVAEGTLRKGRIHIGDRC